MLGNIVDGGVPSWLENRAKVDIDQDEWDSIKARIGEYF